MQSYTFNFEVKDLLTQFLQAFDGAIVNRYDSGRNSGNTVGVRYIYSPKQRVLNDLVDKAQHITLPAVAFWITSIQRDQSRVFNKLEGHYYNDGENFSSNRHILQPVPINIEVSVSILTRFQNDMDQIISNFVPYSDPYFIISWTREGLPSSEIRTEVLWNGNLAMGYPLDLTANQPARITCDTNFTIKGWLFKADANPVGRIFKIDSNFYSVSATPSFTNLDYITGSATTEKFVLSAVPQPHFIHNYLATKLASGTVEIYGGSLGWTNAVYVSGASGMFLNTTTLSSFALSPTLSATYPSLTGVSPALNYSISTDNLLVINYPKPYKSGNAVFYIINEAGYGQITINLR